MGSIIGSVIGGVGSIIGADAQADAAKEAAQASLTGFNYLTKGPGAEAMQGYIDAGGQATQGQMATQNAYASLLGMPAPYQTAPEETSGGGGPTFPTQSSGTPGSTPEDLKNTITSTGKLPLGGINKHVSSLHSRMGIADPTPQDMASSGGGNTPQTAGGDGGATGTGDGGAGTARSAFDNYLNSTGYQFRLGEGQNAINSNAAASGLLNSGGTAKGLEKYGQNLATGYFNDYLGQLGNLNAQQAGVAQAGQNALGQIGSVGSTAGGGAANAIIGGGNAQAAGIAGAASNFGNALSTGLGSIGGFGGGGGGISANAMNAVRAGGGGLY